jgi:hypothetical protein
MDRPSRRKAVVVRYKRHIAELIRLAFALTPIEGSMYPGETTLRARKRQTLDIE